jgi:hypothetical protein
MEDKTEAVGPDSLGTRLSGIWGKVQDWWRCVLDLWAVIRPCRFSAFMAVAGFAFLVVAPQGQDTLREFVESRELAATYLYRQLFFVVAAALWAVFSWYFARVTLAFKFPSSPDLDGLTAAGATDPRSKASAERIRRFCFVVPRWLGTACLVTVGLGHLVAATAYRKSPSVDLLAPMLIIGAAYLLAAYFFHRAVTRRRALMQPLHEKAKLRTATRHKALQIAAEILAVTPEDQERFFHLRDLRGLAWQTWVAIGLTAAVAFSLFLLFTVAPVSTGQFLGAATIILFAAGGWIVFGSALVYVGSAARLPVFTGIFIAAVVFSFWNDNHAVRTVEATTEAPANPATAPRTPANRPRVGEKFTAWIDAMNMAYPRRERHPLVVVAAEGGGIRAAYWTGTVLAELDDRSQGAFGRHVFALSGVSGGSLGSAVYASLVAERASGGIPRCRTKEADEHHRATMRECAQSILSRDFLGPVVGKMLYSDLVARVSPVAIPGFDRGRALEDAWTESWREALPEAGTSRFADGLQALRPDEPASATSPALMLNATWVEKGKRVVSSHVRLVPDDFADAVDLYDVVPGDVPLSVAAHLSARFTYVSPAGTLVDAKGDAWGHVVDGGYFENSGATTALEVLAAIQRAAKPEDWQRIRPVVISITNEPSRDHNRQAPAADDDGPVNWAREVLSPLRALLNTRGARGTYSREAIRQAAVKLGGEFYHFGLCKQRIPLPLGWQLSRLAEQEIQRQLTADCAGLDNGATLTTVADLVSGPKSR